MFFFVCFFFYNNFIAALDSNRGYMNSSSLYQADIFIINQPC